MKADILYQFDDLYAPFAGVSLLSLFINNTHFSEINIYIMGDSISKENIQKLNYIANSYKRKLIYIDTSIILEEIKKAGIPAWRSSYAPNMRLFVSKVIPDNVQRLLYLDSDTLIPGKLDELINIDFADHPAAAVISSLSGRYKKTLGFKSCEKYYNSGVILFNMPVWKVKKCTERILEHAANIRASYAAPDQDLLNIVLKNDILTLDPQYNLQPHHLVYNARTYFLLFSKKGYYSEDEVNFAIKNPVIYHMVRYLGESIWHKNSLHPAITVFDYYLALSPWADYIKQDAGCSTILRIEKKLYQKLPKWIFLMLFKICHDCYMYKANIQSLKKR